MLSVGFNELPDFPLSYVVNLYSIADRHRKKAVLFLSFPLRALVTRYALARSDPPDAALFSATIWFSLDSQSRI